MSNILKGVKKIIDKWDPIELLGFCPQDEYEREVELITVEIQKNLNIISVSLIAKIIFEIFISQFDEDIFNKTIEDCEIIAKKIIDLL